MDQRRIYYCKRAVESPTLDGKPDGSAWALAERIEAGFHLLGSETERSASFLDVRALWDEEALYVSFVSDPPPVPVTKTERDEDLFNECAVEVFLGAGDGYYEIEVNPRGAVLDLYFPNVDEQDWRAMAKYDVPGMVWTVHDLEDAGKWCAQLAIPWKGVPEIARTEVEGCPAVVANFARSQVLPDGAYDLTSWSPAQKAFCELDAMGLVVLIS
ncbi:MAG: carbohydrate-binding family 9-like protein [bacterium]|nr:carbohydrate-binding family 9-like protein [bacterium]